LLADRVLVPTVITLTARTGSCTASGLEQAVKHSTDKAKRLPENTLAKAKEYIRTRMKIND
jgi:hypothetical protein